MATNTLELKSLDEICEWLVGQGFADSVVTSFRDQELDGSAITVGLGATPGPDWLKDVVPVLGLRLKVHNALRTFYNECQPSSTTKCDGHRFDLSPLSSPGEGDGFQSPPGPSSTVSVRSGSSRSGSKSLASKPNRKVGSVPQPFPIPKFRPSTEENLQNKILKDTDRKYIVQTLATLLMTHVQRPSLRECGLVAKALVGKCEFLKDDEGDGEHSWKWFIYYRCQNVNRQAKQDGTARKRPKVDVREVHFYPPVHADDDVAYGRNLELLKAEMGKTKPRSEVMKDLMRRTFPNRWNNYVVNNEPSTLVEYLLDFPLLKKATFAGLEFALVCKEENIRDTFEEQFPLWAQAIITYCRDTQIRFSALQAETASYSEDLDGGHCALMALRCLALLFAPMKQKKLETNIPYILKIVPRGTPPGEAPENNNNQPHIVLFSDSDEGDDNDRLAEQHFIAVEQDLMIETSTIVAAIFFCLSAHYIFNLSYHPKTGDVWVFVQEKILGIPSKTGVKRNPSTLSHFSGITRVFESLSNPED